MTQTPEGVIPRKYSMNKLKGLSMKRFAIFMTVWAMGLTGALASVLIPSTASAQIPGVVAPAISPGSLVSAPTAAGYVLLTPRKRRTGPIALLSTSSQGVGTTRISVGTPMFFDASGSTAGTAGVTVTKGSLTYRDGTPSVALTGGQWSWFDTHSFVAAGSYRVTLTITDSANVTTSTVVTVTVFPAPTAVIAIAGNPTSVQVGAPVTFTLTPSTPLGTAITSWTVYGVWLAGGYGALPPATVTHTFDAPGTYTIYFDFSTDAIGLAQSSMLVTVLP